MSTDWSVADPVSELRYALAEAEADAGVDTEESDLLTRALARAAAERVPGHAIDPADRVSGTEAFERQTAVLRALLTELTDADWSRPTVRDLDVQGLMGHLIGVESAFAAMLAGDTSAADADHVASTQAAAEHEWTRTPQQTMGSWLKALRQSLTALRLCDGGLPVRFHGMGLPLADLMTARAFEIWTHADDIRRALGLATVDPEPQTLATMTDLGVLLLPLALRAGHQGVAGNVRLVLTGPGGGTWDIRLGEAEVRRATLGSAFAAHVVADTAEFCRVIANRADLSSSGAIVREDRSAADALFTAAASLALD